MDNLNSLDELFSNVNSSKLTDKFLQMGETDDIQDIINGFFEDEDDKPVIHNAYKQDDLESLVLCKKCNLELSNVNGDVICKECGILYNDINICSY